MTKEMVKNSIERLLRETESMRFNINDWCYVEKANYKGADEIRLFFCTNKYKKGKVGCLINARDVDGIYSEIENQFMDYFTMVAHKEIALALDEDGND